MAYGITAAGKTHTIEGTLESPGLIQRSMARLFDTLQHRDTTSISPEIEISYCEIYNESIYDLLADQPPQSQPHQRQQLRLVDAEGRVEVAGLVRICIQSLEQGVAVLQRGSRARARGGTGLNLSSSRSHSIFTITFRDTLRGTSSQRLAFVDLAGSERVQRTGNVGVRLKESVAINASLMTLGRCLEALAWNQKQQQQQQQQRQLRVVPYRESKITHLFRDALHGYGTVVLSVNVSPAASDYDETVHVLRYASLATGIETTTCVDQKTKALFKKKVTKADKAPALLRRRLLKAAASAKRKKRNGFSKQSPLIDACGTQVNKRLSNGSVSTPLPSPRTSHDRGTDPEQSQLQSELHLRQDPLKLQSELQAQVQQLIKDLQAAEERAVLVEAEVREEVALELAELLREMEDRYKERVAMEVAAAESRLESRLQQMQHTEQRLRETEEALRIAQAQLESQEREWKEKEKEKEKETGEFGHRIYLEHRIQEEITQKEANAAMELGMAEREIERLRKEIVSLKSQLSMVTSALEAVASPTVPLTSRLAACSSAGYQDEVGQAGATPHEIALHRALKALHAVDDEEKEDGREVRPATTNTRALSRLGKCTSVHCRTDTDSAKTKTKEKEAGKETKKRSKPASRISKKKQTLQEMDPNEGNGAHSSRSSSNPKDGTIDGTGTLPENGQEVLPMKTVEPKSVKRRLLGVSRAGLESIVSPNTLYSPFVRASPYSREGRL
jgi:hypothetical protein